MGHMSNRDRIARAAEEASLREAEKAAKAAKAPKAPKKAGKSKKDVRMKIVWEVCSASGTVVETFAYPDKAAAEAAIERLTKAGSTHLLRATKVPME